MSMNSPPQIDVNSNMTPRFKGQICKFSTSPLSPNCRKRLKHIELKTKYRKMTRKPWSLVRILMYRTWVITTP